MPTKLTASFDELIKNRYGSHGDAERMYALRIDDLFNGYYGLGATNGRSKQANPAVVLSLSADNGETLPQARRRTRAREYVVTQSAASPQLAPARETRRGPARARTQTAAAAEYVAQRESETRPEEVSAQNEYSIDISEPLRDAPPSGERARSQTATAQSQPQDSDFIEDMKSILSGQMVFDPVSKKTVDKDAIGRKPSAEQESASGMPAPDAKNSQAIFERIKQSMEYANAYNLGTIELANRFNDFDAMAELQAKAAARVPASVPAAPGVTPAPRTSSRAGAAVDSEDFIRDLEAIRTPSATAPVIVAAPAPAPAVVVPPTAPPAVLVASAPPAPPLYTQAPYGQAPYVQAPYGQPTYVQTSPAPAYGQAPYSHATYIQARPVATPHPQAPYSQPLFDAGEHVRTAGDLYEGRLRVGRPPGILCSYGQIIAMADLYESVDQMMAAAVAELQRVKALIEQSTAHYTTGAGRDVSTSDWDAATGGRYLRLAENNYEHFSPPPPLRGMAPLPGGRRYGDNRAVWETYHRRALDEARRLFLAAPPNVSLFLEWPLIINAFGDHFLTDAFASGHVINKESVIAAFKSNFLNGRSLKPEGTAFFQKVAGRAFTGEVARRFSALETVDYPVCAHGWCFAWRPNIDSASMFARVLSAAAEQQPDRIANFAVKALHDHLNREGIEVTNDAGDGTWTLKGDGFLDSANLRIVRKAVQQSVDNVNDPSIFSSSPDFAAYFARVWRHVPRLTDVSLRRVTGLVRDYTNPGSTVLVDAAGRIIHKEVDALVKALVSEGKLQAA